MTSPASAIRKPWFNAVWCAAAGISILVLAVIVTNIFRVVAECDVKPPNCKPIPVWIKALYGMWTVGVPVYFMFEWVFGIDWKVAQDAENKAKLEYQKSCQDHARLIWAAFATAIGLFLLTYKP